MTYIWDGRRLKPFINISVNQYLTQAIPPGTSKIQPWFKLRNIFNRVNQAQALHFWYKLKSMMSRSWPNRDSTAAAAMTEDHDIIYTVFDFIFKICTESITILSQFLWRYSKTCVLSQKNDPNYIGHTHSWTITLKNSI